MLWPSVTLHRGGPPGANLLPDKHPSPQGPSTCSQPLQGSAGGSSAARDPEPAQELNQQIKPRSVHCGAHQQVLRCL